MGEGVGESVGEKVGVLVGVFVAVLAKVAVGVKVGVWVAVWVDVAEGTEVYVFVGAGKTGPAGLLFLAGQPTSVMAPRPKKVIIK